VNEFGVSPAKARRAGLCLRCSISEQPKNNQAKQQVAKSAERFTKSTSCRADFIRFVHKARQP
jgi:hypothetical protein